MALATTESTQISRPLRVLVPLIKEDIRLGDEAAQTAGMPHYIAAGEKLLESKGQMSHGEFIPWCKRNFNRSPTTTAKYMLLAKQNSRAREFSTVNAFHRATNNPAYMPNKPRPQPWHDPVKEAIGRVNIETLKQDALARQEERKLQRKLALSLIDIGYKALATKLHPDKGGSREAMVRLNAVRKILQGAVTA